MLIAIAMFAVSFLIATLAEKLQNYKIIPNLLGILSLFVLCLGFVLTIGVMNRIMNSCS